MQVHHLSTAKAPCARQRALVLGEGLFTQARLVCHCLLIESDGSGLVLVDTGLGLADIRTRRLGQRFPCRNAPAAAGGDRGGAGGEAGVPGARTYGIIPTHLDLDHVGRRGLPSREGARLPGRKYAAAMAPVGRSAVRLPRLDGPTSPCGGLTYDVE